MKMSKALGPSGIVVEMIQAADDKGSLQLQSVAMARYSVTGSKVSLSASTRVRGCMEKGKLTWSKADKAGHEGPGEDCGLPHQIDSVNRRFLVLLCPRQRHNRCNLCRPGEGF